MSEPQRFRAIDLVHDYPGVEVCDCGHPVSYHHALEEGGFPNGCHYCPPKSRVLCRCAAVTTTGVVRDERYLKP